MKQICRMNQKTLLKSLTKYLKTTYNKILNTDSFIIAEGDIPIALVAHMDTVFKKLPSEIFYDKENKVMWSPQGLGADDRAGICAILEILNKGYRPHIIFTTDEEVGGIGALNLIKVFQNSPFEDLKYIIELDRRGKNDCVFYDCDNKEFTRYIESFGFKSNWGSFSDISIIAPEWEVAAVNLSIGYEDEHSEMERLYIKNMEKTIDKVIKMLDKTKDKDSNVPNFAYIKRKNISYYGSFYSLNKKGYCSWCGNKINGFPNKISFGSAGVDEVCDECFSAYMSYEMPRIEK